VGKKRVTVTNTMRLLKLPQRLLEALAAEEITEGHARALLTLATPQSQLAAFATIQRDGLNVRQTENLVRKLQGMAEPRPPKPPRSPESDALTDRLRDRLGTKVTLKRGRKGGSLTLFFQNDEDLNSIATAILGE
jgi:ParB family chromosome partitioning protein